MDANFPLFSSKDAGDFAPLFQAGAEKNFSGTNRVIAQARNREFKYALVAFTPLFPEKFSPSPVFLLPP